MIINACRHTQKYLVQDLCQWFTLWSNLAINLQTPLKTNHQGPRQSLLLGCANREVLWEDFYNWSSITSLQAARQPVPETRTKLRVTGNVQGLLGPLANPRVADLQLWLPRLPVCLVNGPDALRININSLALFSVLSGPLGCIFLQFLK